ncbi:hypothetical protein [Micromonospora musae]|uniref:WD40 repeat domain-containing protein n=1 Tax=Micromonospora musae TaxID=1894970 RepID=A0A3A9XWJ6_9ACTN|nr:hypothetical protein [Micromonospora musae]RKN29508.1 hypothetical protein D7044_21900 [Micromonospora musae]
MDRNITPRVRVAPRALMAAAALVLLPVAASGCAAPAPANEIPPLPATAPATEPAHAVLAAGSGGAGGSTPPAAASRPTSPSPSAVAVRKSWPQLAWHSEPEYGVAGGAPARVWRSTPDGRWELVREASSADPDVEGKVVASPDGRRAAWLSAKPNRLAISRFEGGSVVSVPLQGTLDCAPQWLDNLTLVYAEGQQGDWTVIETRADRATRNVIATHQATCPIAGHNLIGFVQDRTLRVGDGSGAFRTVAPRIPANLRIHGLAGFSLDGRSLVISAHVPNAGECACTWRIRNYQVTLATGAATELAPLDPAWREATGHGIAEHVTFRPDGTLLAQINTATPTDDAPAYRLVRYAADGRVLASLPVPAGTPWGRLLG